MLLHPQKGFTLIELLIVMAIMGLLIGVAASSFQTSRIKGKDAKRKSDLRQIGSALESYFNDHSKYPASTGGVITACGDGTATCPYGSAFTDENGTTYMAQIPQDANKKANNQTYFYAVSSDGKMYQLFAYLENSQDPDIKTYTTSCGPSITCNYGISSPNTTPSSALP